MPETALVPWMQCHLERAEAGERHFSGTRDELAPPLPTVLSLVSRRDTFKDG